MEGIECCNSGLAKGFVKPEVDAALPMVDGKETLRLPGRAEGVTRVSGLVKVNIPKTV